MISTSKKNIIGEIRVRLNDSALAISTGVCGRIVDILLNKLLHLARK